MREPGISTKQERGRKVSNRVTSKNSKTKNKVDPTDLGGKSTAFSV